MVRLEHVTKTYGGEGKDAVHDLSLEIRDGQFVVLVGTSGCGKTTTLKMINRLIEPTSGKILMDGRDIRRLNPVELRRKIGYVIQQIGLFPNMTIRENIEVVPRLLKWPREKSRKRAEELMNLVGLPPAEYAAKYPSELSGGQQQRVGVMRALAGDPEMILMDEPFGALDPITRDSLQDEVKRIQRSLKKTFVFVTHDMAEAVKLADVIVFMHEGRVVQMAPPEEILEHPASGFVRQFIGRHATENSAAELPVTEVMRTNPTTVTRDRKLFECISLMDSKGIDSLIVTDEDGKLEGVVSIEALQQYGKPGEPIGDIETRDVRTVPVTGDARSAFETLHSTRDEYLVVTDGERRVVGIITRTGMVRSMARALWGGGAA